MLNDDEIETMSKIRPNVDKEMDEDGSRCFLAYCSSLSKNMSAFQQGKRTQETSCWALFCRGTLAAPQGLAKALFTEINE
ncbi:hypothetical protein TNCV_631941 [Trichonephila clavipes]|nr:hypothetical protein TNCV_631941 [Trichonephila clavipes]